MGMVCSVPVSATVALPRMATGRAGAAVAVEVVERMLIARPGLVAVVVAVLARRSGCAVLPRRPGCGDLEDVKGRPQVWVRGGEGMGMGMGEGVCRGERGDRKSWSVEVRRIASCELLSGWLKPGLMNKGPGDRDIGLELGGVSQPCGGLVCVLAGRRKLGTGGEGVDGIWRIVSPLDAVLTLRSEPESGESLPVITRSPTRRLGCHSCSDACSMTFWLEPTTKTTCRRYLEFKSVSGLNYMEK